jgi:hypothetical protein
LAQLGIFLENLVLFLKTSFLTVAKQCVDFKKNLEIGLRWFEAYLQKLQKKREIRKRKRTKKGRKAGANLLAQPLKRPTTQSAPC